MDLTCQNGEGVTALDNVSFDAYGGEILGIAGIAGSGQKELCEVIAGLYPAIGGAVLYSGEKNGVPVRENLLGMSPDVIVQKGVSMAFVPEDRLGMGLVASMDMTDNVMLRSYKSGKGIFVDRKSPRELAERMIDELGNQPHRAWIPRWDGFRAAMCRRCCWAVRSPQSVGADRSLSGAGTGHQLLLPHL